MGKGSKMIGVGKGSKRVGVGKGSKMRSIKCTRRGGS